MMLAATAFSRECNAIITAVFRAAANYNRSR
jgi:hypothetical protein